MEKATGGDQVRVLAIGRYDRIDCETFEVYGTAKVVEDVFADEASVYGTAKVGGDLLADELSVGGSVKIDGDASVTEATLDGATSVGGNLDGHVVEGSGATRVGGSLVAGRVTFDGAVKVGEFAEVTELGVRGAGSFGDVNADVFAAEGGLVAGSVAAHEFELVIEGDSEVDRLDGDDIVVTRGSGTVSFADDPVDGTLDELFDDGDGGFPDGWLGGLLGGGFGQLFDGELGDGFGQEDPVFEAGTITGESVELDCTRAETVVGEHVELGADTEVEVVYTDDLQAHENARVGEVRAYDEYEEDGEVDDEGDGEGDGEGNEP